MGRLGIASASVALLVAGCGGGGGSRTTAAAPAGGDRAAIEATFHTYVGRLAAHDGDGACAAMAPSLQRRMLAAMEQAGAGALVRGKSCGQVLDFIAEQSAAYNRAAAAIADATITDVRIDGDTANYDWSMKVGGKTVAQRGEASRAADGNWLVSCCVPGQE